MAHWGPIKSFMVGGLVAVGFVDEHRIVVGSHAGLGVFNAESGVLLDRGRDRDGDYGWYGDSPSSAAYADGDGEHLVQVAGLWGGALPTVTDDGWKCCIATPGALLTGPDGTVITVDDTEEPRACGFAALGQVFVYATSSSLHVAVRLPN